MTFFRSRAFCAEPLVFPDQLFLVLCVGIGKHGNLDHQVFAPRQELVQRRIQRADRHREPVHRFEDARKIVALHRQQFLQRNPPVFFVVGQNHGLHVRDAVFGKEHMLGAAQADSLGSECPGLDGIARNIRVGANLQLAKRVGPLHEGLQFRIIGRRRQSIELSFDHAAGRAVERNPVACLEHLALDAHLASFLVDLNVARARHAALAHAACNHGRVTGHATARGQNARRDFHAVNIFRRGLTAHQNDRRLLAKAQPSPPLRRR